MVSGSISVEVQVNAPASAAWAIYGTLKLPRYTVAALPDVIDRIQVQGDGCPGTVIELFFLPDTTGFAFYKEQYKVVDNEKMMKIADVIEGAYLDLGFTLYRLRFDVIKKDEKSCITKGTIEYDIKGDFADNVSLVTTDSILVIMKYIANSLVTKSPKYGYSQLSYY